MDIKKYCLPQLYSLPFHICLLKCHGQLQRKQSRRYSFFVAIIYVLLVGTPHQSEIYVLRERLQLKESVNIWLYKLFFHVICFFTNFNLPVFDFCAKNVPGFINSTFGLHGSIIRGLSCVVGAHQGDVIVCFVQLRFVSLLHEHHNTLRQFSRKASSE
jgi:hypothetical protein